MTDIGYISTGSSSNAIRPDDSAERFNSSCSRRWGLSSVLLAVRVVPKEEKSLSTCVKRLSDVRGSSSSAELNDIAKRVYGIY